MLSQQSVCAHVCAVINTDCGMSGHAHYLSGNSPRLFSVTHRNPFTVFMSITNSQGTWENGSCKQQLIWGKYCNYMETKYRCNLLYVHTLYITLYTNTRLADTDFYMSYLLCCLATQIWKAHISCHRRQSHEVARMGRLPTDYIIVIWPWESGMRPCISCCFPTVR